MTSGITLPVNGWHLEILQMPLNTTHEDIKNQFTKYGSIDKIGFVYNNSLNCYLSYVSELDSMNATKENGKIVGANSISVIKFNGDSDSDKGNKRLRTDDKSDGWGTTTTTTTSDDTGGWGTSNTNTTSSWGSSPQGGGGGGRGGRGGGRGGGRSCFNCGDEGHMSRECTKPRGGGRGGGNGGTRSCFKCGEEGHMSRECPKGGGGGRACFNCNEEGHMSRECPKPRAERGRGRGRGGGRGGSRGNDSNTNSSTNEWGTGDSAASTQSALAWD